MWAANGTGHMQLLVLKTNKLLDALKGAGGSVRTLALYPGVDADPLLASVGLDRFLRVHDLSSRASKGRVYLKQQLTAVVWLPVQQPAGAAAGAAEEAVGGGEGRLAAAGSSKKSKKKKKSMSTEYGAGDGVDGAAPVEGADKKHSKKRRKQA